MSWWTSWPMAPPPVMFPMNVDIPLGGDITLNADVPTDDDIDPHDDISLDTDVPMDVDILQGSSITLDSDVPVGDGSLHVQAIRDPAVMPESNIVLPGMMLLEEAMRCLSCSLGAMGINQEDPNRVPMLKDTAGLPPNTGAAL